mgnify:CR=1 FL=1
MNRDAFVPILQARVPRLLAIYAFGSRITGTARPDSDLDLAVLVAGYADPLALFYLAGDLADIQQRETVYGRGPQAHGGVSQHCAA